MPDKKTLQALCHLLQTIYRSLPMYLTDATPWTHKGDERAVEALRHIVADQKATCGKIAQYLQDHQAPVNSGDYPMDYTDMHDLSLEYLISRLITCQQRDLATTERVVAIVAGEPAARAIAEEALGSGRAHLESLEELAAQAASPVQPSSAAV